MPFFQKLVGSLRWAILLLPLSHALSHASSLASALEPIVQARVHQSTAKMKLKVNDAEQFKSYLEHLTDPIPKITALQKIMPKTTVELLMATHQRGLSLKEAEKMAAYLITIANLFQFSNPKPFDENTSHIIGREWSEIDYSGENLTWQKQKSKYRPYGIDHFKSLDCLKKFIPIESKLPYFKNIYRPKNPTPIFP